MRIAYRTMRGSKFTNLWPRRDPRPFEYAYGKGNDPFAPCIEAQDSQALAAWHARGLGFVEGAILATLLLLLDTEDPRASCAACCG